MCGLPPLGLLRYEVRHARALRVFWAFCGMLTAACHTSALIAKQADKSSQVTSLELDKVYCYVRWTDSAPAGAVVAQAVITSRSFTALQRTSRIYERDAGGKCVWCYALQRLLDDKPRASSPKCRCQHAKEGCCSASRQMCPCSFANNAVDWSSTRNRTLSNSVAYRPD